MSIDEAIVQAFIFISGAIVGSFLNVCIIRIPQEKSIVFPGSHCPSCQKPIQWYDNVPLLSYLALKGRCRNCGKKISLRYFTVELTTAVFFVLLYRHFGLSLILLPLFIFISGLIIATFVDLELRIIPDEISIGGMVVGFVMSFLFPQLQATDSHFGAAGQSLLGILVGGGSIYAMGMLGDFLFKKESMGGGDVKLLAMIGSFLGWQMAVLAFFIAPFFGAILGIIVKIRTKESAIAYGPFLSLGAVISLFWGHDLIRLVLSGYGLPY